MYPGDVWCIVERELSVCKILVEEEVGMVNPRMKAKEGYPRWHAWGTW